MLRIMPANTKVSKLYSIPELKCYLEGVKTVEINGIRRTSKLNRSIYNFDLRAGYTCPAADICLSKVIEMEDGTRKIQDGPNTIVRCFAASVAALRPKVYDLQKQNEMTLRELKTESKMQSAIENAIPEDAGIIRIHSSGDFYCSAYFKAWRNVAIKRPDMLFYGYTKRNDFLAMYRNTIPRNFIFTASKGGKYDNLIFKYNLRHSIIVENQEHADRLGIPVDDDDSHAANPTSHVFGLIVHGVQMKNRMKLDVI